MKKILLSFAAIGCALLANAQIVLNEIYVRPNPNPSPGHQEYFELKNTSNLPQNADCYTVVTYFENAVGDEGFYVVDIPAITIGGRGYLTASSQAPTFVYQNGNGTADFSWNAGNINRYIYTTSGLTLNNSGAPYDNIFVKSNGAANGAGGLYAVFLFKSGVLVDALLGAHNTTTVPDCIKAMGVLNHAGGCGSISYNFANINNTAAGIIANVNPEAGTDNGYHRVGGDCSNPGTWQKASSPSEHTPGAANPGQNNSGPNANQMLQADAMCIDNVTVQYNITAGNNGAFPVTVSLYWDANGSQFLDSGDVFIGSQVDGSVNDPAKTFSHPSGQEDFIFVFDAKGGCYDTTMPLNCPAAIILPVTWKTFTATRDGNQVALKWTTATEVDNRGFNVQRLLGSGNWENVAFIASKATGGNSASDLSYTYTDVNGYKGVSQYRLQQVDHDGKYKYSEIRSVRSDDATGGGVKIYPNPSNGATTIAFQTLSTSHDVFISDMSGRIVKQYRGITDDNLRVSNLTPGVYAIRIVDQRTGTQSNERLVVSGR